VSSPRWRAAIMAVRPSDAPLVTHSHGKAFVRERPIGGSPQSPVSQCVPMGAPGIRVSFCGSCAGYRRSRRRLAARIQEAARRPFRQVPLCQLRRQVHVREPGHGVCARRRSSGGAGDFPGRFWKQVKPQAPQPRSTRRRRRPSSRWLPGDAHHAGPGPRAAPLRRES